MTEVVVREMRMSAYEQKVGDGLTAYWERRDNARGRPYWMSDALEKGKSAVRTTTDRVVDAVPEAVKKSIRQASDAAINVANRPTIETAAAPLDLVNDWANELNDRGRLRSSHASAASTSSVSRTSASTTSRTVTGS